MPTLARHAGILGLFTALGVAHTWPLARTPSHQIHASGDALLGMWSLNELARRIVTDPLHLMDGNIFYPFRTTLAIADHQVASAIVAAPASAAGVSGFYIYNCTLILTFVLSGYFTWLLARRLTGSTGAALVAGCAYAFSGYRAGHLLHAHLLVTQWLPLTLLGLHRYVERPTWRRWIGFAIPAILLALSSWHLAIIGAIGVGVVTLWITSGDVARARRPLIGLVLAAALCGLLLLPLASAYARMGEQFPPLTGEGRETLDSVASMSTSIAGLVTPSPTSRAPYASWLAALEPARIGVFPGVVVIALSLLAAAPLTRWRLPHSRFHALLRGGVVITAALALLVSVAAAIGPAGQRVVDLLRPVAPFALFGLALLVLGLAAGRHAGATGSHLRLVLTYTALSVTGILLALGPQIQVGSVDVGSGLWRLDLLPVRLMIRAPERLSLLLALGTAVLAGIGAARLLAGRGRLAAIALGTVLLIAVNADLRFASPELRPVPGPTEADRWLAQAPEDGAVVDFPLHWTNVWAMSSSQWYGRRIVNGTGYLIPGPYLDLEGQPDLSPGQMAVLWQDFHPRFAVVRTHLYPPEERARVLAAIAAQPDALRERARFGSEYVFEVVDQGRGAEVFRRWPVEDLRGAHELHFTARVSPPRPGTTGELLVSLNGRLLLEQSDAATAVPVSYRAPYTDADLVEGSNEFAITASYRFAETAGAHLVGATGTQLAADVAVTADRLRALVVVNGRVWRPERGYFLVALDPATGRVIRTGGFDVSWHASEAEALTRFIEELPTGAAVVVTTEFDASRELTPAAVSALASLGIVTDLRGQFQVMHAAIGVKGAAPGSALEATDRQSVNLALGRMDRPEVELSSLGIR